MFWQNELFKIHMPFICLILMISVHVTGSPFQLPHHVPSPAASSRAQAAQAVIEVQNSQF